MDTPHVPAVASLKGGVPLLGTRAALAVSRRVLCRSFGGRPGAILAAPGGHAKRTLSIAPAVTASRNRTRLRPGSPAGYRHGVALQALPNQRRWVEHVGPSSRNGHKSGTPGAAGSLQEQLQQASTPRAVLEVLKDSGSNEPEEGYAAAVRAAAGLCALARCLAQAGALHPGELPEVQDAVRRLVTQLSVNAYDLPFHELAEAIAALEALLPPLRWPRLLADAKAVHSLLAALLPAAASAVRPAAKAPASLGQLCAAFRSVLQVVALMRSAGHAGAAITTDTIATAARVYGDDSDDDSEEDYEEEGDTHAVEAAATEEEAEERDGLQLEDLEVATLDRASCFLRTEVYSGKGMRQRLAAADLASLAGAVELVDAYGLAAPRVFVEALTARVDSLVAAAVAARERGGATRGPDDSTAAYLDVVSLARLVEAWCWAAARPQPTAASAAPEDAWLARMADIVLATQDTAAVAAWHAAYNRVAELRARLAEVEGQLEEAKARLTEAKKAQAEAWRRAAKQGPRGRKRKEGEGDGDEQADAADSSADIEQAFNDAKATTEKLEAAVRAERAAVAAAERALASLRPAPAATQQCLEGGALVALLAALSRGLGKRVGPELERRAEAVLRQRLDAGDLEPRQVVQVLQTLLRVGHAPSHGILVSALRLLRPYLPQLSPADAATLCTVLRASTLITDRVDSSGAAQSTSDRLLAAGVLPDLLRALAVEGDVSGREGAGLGRLPSGVLLWLVRACEEWRVALPAAQVQQLEAVAAARAGRAEQALAAESTADADALAMREQLLSGVVLPLARTGLLRHTSGRAFAAALGCGGAGGGGVYRLDERGAALLLGGVRQEWGMGPEGRQALSALVGRSLALCLQAGAPAALVSLLLAAGRAVRVMASGSEGSRSEDLSFVDAAGPEADRLLPLALERLLRLQPSADQLAAVAHEYFVALRWCNPAGPAVPQQARAQGKAQLALVLKAATPQLGTCRLESLAMMLEACVTVRVRPPPDWLTAVFNSAAAALRDGSANRGAATADKLTMLLDSVKELDGMMAGTPATSAAAIIGRPGQAFSTPPPPPVAVDVSGVMSDKSAKAAPGMGMATEGTAAALRKRTVHGPSLTKARDTLLAAISVAVLEDPALQAFRSDPSALVSAARSLCGLGVRPPEPWLRSYMALLQREGLGPGRLAAPDLVALVQGLAGMRAAPPPDFLDALLLAAGGGDGDGGDRASSDVPLGFSPAQLGILLAGVRTLWRNAAQHATGLAPSPALSHKAAAVWDSAHTLSKSQWSEAVATYEAPELFLAVDAVLAYELEPRPRGADGSDGGSSGAGFNDGATEKWLGACCESLLQLRNTQSSGSAAAALQPPVTLPVDLLRLASRVLCGRSDGGVAPLAELASSSTAAARIVEYVRTCLAEFVVAAVDGGAAASVPAFGSPVALPDWHRLLSAAMAAGIRPEPPELGAYASALFGAAANSMRSVATCAGGDAEGGASAYAGAPTPESEDTLVRSWSQLGAGLREVLLPALPSLPHRRHVQQLQQGLAGLAPALAAATGEQLAALCTWVVQAGPEVAPVGGEWWQALRDELIMRLQTGTAAPGALQERERYTPYGFAATELAAVCYGLMAGGCDIPRLGGLLWVAIGISAMSGASDATLLGAAPSALRALSALQLLWVARSCGCLAEVPEGVWEVAYGGGVEGSASLEVLRPAQLAQMVLLWAERRRGGAGAGAAAAGQPGMAQSEAWLRALSGLYAKQGSASKQESAQGAREVQDEPGSSALWEHEPPLDAAVAAHAVAYCMPRAPPGSPLPPYAPALCDAALPAVAEALRAADVVAFLGALEGRTGWAVPQQQLQVLATRLAGAEGGDSDSEGGEQAAGSPLAQLPAAEVLQVALALLRAAPPPPDGLSAVLPALVALAPNAESELCGMVIPERMGRAVLATGLEAGLWAVCMLDIPSSWEMAAASAAEAAAVLAAIILTPHEQPPDACSSGAGPGASSITGLASLPAASLAELASAVISAGGQQPLPRPAAALLLRLLAVDGVLELLPDAALEQALQRSLSGTGVPMPDTVAAALDARLRAAVEAGRKAFAFPVARGAALRRCGASAVWSHRVLRGLLDLPDKDMVQLTPAQALEALAEMQASGVRERLAPAQRPGRREKAGTQQDAMEHYRKTALLADGPFAALLVALMTLLSVLASCHEVQWRQAAAALRACAELVPRLEGAYCAKLLQYVHDVALESAAKRGEKGFVELLRRDPSILWSTLSAMQELGGHQWNRLVAKRALRVGAMATLDPVHRAAVVTDPRVIDAEDDILGIPLKAQKQLGAHLIGGHNSLFIFQAASRLLEDHAEACEQLRRQDAGAARDRAFGKAAGVGDGGNGDGGPALLSARQLGQLYGLLTLGVHAAVPKREMDRALRQIEEPYYSALARLAARTDLPPLEHLTAVLDALEPALIIDTRDELRLPGLYKTKLKPAKYIAPALARALTDPRVTAEPFPEGLTTMDDFRIVAFPGDLSKVILEEALFAAPLEGAENGSPPAHLLHRWPHVPLPPALRPPPGRRHGMPGDPDGDAAREAYVRSIAPWFVLARRMHYMLAGMDCRGEVLTTLQSLGVKPSPTSRWSIILADAVSVDWVGNNAPEAPDEVQWSVVNEAAAADGPAKVGPVEALMRSLLNQGGPQVLPEVLRDQLGELLQQAKIVSPNVEVVINVVDDDAEEGEAEDELGTGNRSDGQAAEERGVKGEINAAAAAAMQGWMRQQAKVQPRQQTASGQAGEAASATGAPDAPRPPEPGGKAAKGTGRGGGGFGGKQKRGKR